MKKITVLLALLAITLFSVSSCAPTVSQQEYDRVNDELSTIQSQLASLQSKLAEAEIIKAKNEELNKQYDTVKSEYDELQDKYEGLGSENEEMNKQYDAMKSEYDTLKAKYEELSRKYEELGKQCSATIEETPEIITEENVEQAIFELVNLERKNNGLDELIWGVNLYKVAKNHSRSMATNQRLEEPEQGAYQEVIWATGYTKTQIMAEAIFAIWQNTARYEVEFLNSVTTYGVVAVYKSGEIFYITYISDIFR